MIVLKGCTCIHVYIYLIAKRECWRNSMHSWAPEPMAVGFPFSFFVCEHLPSFPLQPSPPFASAAATIPPLTSPSPLLSLALSRTPPCRHPSRITVKTRQYPRTSEIFFSLYARVKNPSVLPSQWCSLMMNLQYTVYIFVLTLNYLWINKLYV